jgi:SWI/SNF-related matrix-associated actin-dependent regulator of chromatin subfamily A3
MRDQIGHIPRQIASKLASYMDSSSLLVEGVLTGTIGQYDCPIALKLFGSSDPVIKAELRARMKGDRLPTEDVTRREQEARKKKAEELKQMKEAKSRKAAEARQSQLGYVNSSQGIGSGPTMDEILEDSQKFNPREMGQVVEKFGSGEEALQALPMAAQPSTIATTLLPYQRQGLAWMLEQENPKLPKNGGEGVQMWKREGQYYRNIATNFAQKAEPRLASGGILADDMGLGKTLQIISLMMEDRKTDPKSKTLILSPLSVMSNWSGQVCSDVIGKQSQ